MSAPTASELAPVRIDRSLVDFHILLASALVRDMTFRVVTSDSKEYMVVLLGGHSTSHYPHYEKDSRQRINYRIRESVITLGDDRRQGNVGFSLIARKLCFPSANEADGFEFSARVVEITRVI